GGRLDQAVDAAHEGGLAAAGQAHHDKDFALVDVERYVSQANGVPVAAQELLLAQSLPPELLQGRFGVWAEEFVQVLHAHLRPHAKTTQFRLGGRGGCERSAEQKSAPEKAFSEAQSVGTVRECKDADTFSL